MLLLIGFISYYTVNSKYVSNSTTSGSRTTVWRVTTLQKKHNSGHHFWIRSAEPLRISLNNLEAQEQTIDALKNKVKESQNRLYTIYKFRCIKPGKDETIVCIKGNSGRRTLSLSEWLVGYGNSQWLWSRTKRVRRTLLEDQLSLARALKYAKGLESTN